MYWFIDFVRWWLFQVDKQEKKKKRTGRAKRRIQYNRRFVNVVPTFGKRKDQMQTHNLLFKMTVNVHCIPE